MNKQFSLGSRLRALRSERGLSQRELASQAGISANAISLIERDENSPSVSTLQNLAGALNVKMSYFFDEEVTKNVLHVKSENCPAITSRGASIAGIGEHIQGQEMEPFFVSLDPHAGSGEGWVTHLGHELVYCLEGNIEYIIDEQAYLLEPGDLLLFEAHLPHEWRNPGDKKARLLLVLQKPDESSTSVARHFSNIPSLRHIG
jgi:transcriptional regulator with XRE-family HTH domain